MANYAYIDLTIPAIPTTLDALEGHVRNAVRVWFRGRLNVSRTIWDDDGPVLLVYLPGSSTDDPVKAAERDLAPGDPVGFTIALQGDGSRIAFRHAGVNQFERWAQGVMEELLAEAYNSPIFFDATDQTVNPGARRYRSGRKRTFYEYVARLFPEPLSADDAAAIQRFEKWAPEGFWR